MFILWVHFAFNYEGNDPATNLNLYLKAKYFGSSSYPTQLGRQNPDGAGNGI